MDLHMIKWIIHKYNSIIRYNNTIANTKFANINIKDITQYTNYKYK